MNCAHSRVHERRAHLKRGARATVHRRGWTHFHPEQQILLPLFLPLGTRRPSRQNDCRGVRGCVSADPASIRLSKNDTATAAPGGPTSLQHNLKIVVNCYFMLLLRYLYVISMLLNVNGLEDDISGERISSLGKGLMSARGG